ncbi:hypothetical protein L1987_84280 [Smallanthus sonchifolius]|uniref:Uncharacterized protein n=1 Tax=Smallanthus sonchifolius TaxID=185202 RepID=A0ACB8YIH0_9ASTR|nr:hypothetical protein L1987_84280 [Smallanthus sonchifolius]
MERIKKRKLKFPCLFGGKILFMHWNDEDRRRRSVQTRSPANPTTDQSLLKFEVGKSTSKQRNENRMKKLPAKGISNGFSAKQRSPCILSKLMGRGRRSSKNTVRSSNERRKNTELVCCATECKWRGATEPTPEISSQVKDGFESGHVGLYGYDDFGYESLHLLRSGPASESEEITVPSRIVFGQHDRLTHSLSLMSESSLIREATNRMLERWNMTHNKEDVGTVSKVSMLGEMLSSPSSDKETRSAESGNVTGLVGVSDIFASPTGLGAILGDCSMDGQEDRHLISTSRSTSLPPSFNDPIHKRNICHEDDADENVYSGPSNQGRRKAQKDVFNSEEDTPLNNVRSNKWFLSSQKSTGTYIKNEDPAKYQQPISDTDVDAQLSGPESEDEAFSSDCLESINSRIQDIKKNLHMLTIGSTLTSNKLTLIPKVKHSGQLSSVAIPEPVSPESSYTTHILQTLENYATAWKSDQTTHHPIDPRLLYHLEKYYFEGTVLLRNEKRLFYDYVEQMYVRALKSTVAYPWVNPEKRESQLRLPKLNLKDQMCNVVDEIGKDEDEDFFEIYYDKDSEWVQPTYEIDILGKFIAELVLNDLLLEVVDV